MNFLAHFHLSSKIEPIAIGNFLGDFVTGNELSQLPQMVQNGVALHRFIDSFTDTHPLIRSLNHELIPHFAKYAPVVSDIYMDYFLASNFSNYSTVSLRNYTNWIYDLMNRYKHIFPERAYRLYHFIIAQDIFYEYGNKDGLQYVFNGLSNRATFDSKMENGVHILIEKQKKFQYIFDRFYPLLQEAASIKLQRILNENK